MTKKVIIFSIFFILLILSVAFANSYVQALPRQNKMVNCYNDCNQNEDCPIYQQDGNCIMQNDNCIQ